MSITELRSKLKLHYDVAFTSNDSSVLDIKNIQNMMGRFNPSMEHIAKYGNYYYFVGVYRNSCMFPLNKNIVKQQHSLIGVGENNGHPYSFGSPWRHSWGFSDDAEYVYDLPIVFHMIMKKIGDKFVVDTIKEQELKNIEVVVAGEKFGIEYLEDPRVFKTNNNELGVYCHYRLDTLEVTRKDGKKLCKMRDGDHDCKEQEFEKYISTQKIALSKIPYKRPANLSELRAYLSKLKPHIKNTPFNLLCNQFVGNNPEKNWAILDANKDSVTFLSSIGFYGSPTVIRSYYNNNKSDYILQRKCDKIENDEVTKIRIEDNNLVKTSKRNKNMINDPFDPIIQKFRKKYKNGVLAGISVGGPTVKLSNNKRLGIGHLKINYKNCKNSGAFIVKLGKYIQRYYVKGLWGADSKIINKIDTMEYNKITLHSNLMYATFFYIIDASTFNVSHVTSPFFMNVLGRPLSFLQFCHTITETDEDYHMPYGRDDFECNILHLSKKYVKQYILDNKVDFKDTNESFDMFFNNVNMMIDTGDGIKIYNNEKIIHDLLEDKSFGNVDQTPTTKSSCHLTFDDIKEINKVLKININSSQCDTSVNILGFKCLKDYKITKLLGTGSVGIVFRGVKNGRKYALKIQRIKGAAKKRGFLRSVEIQKKLSKYSPRVKDHCITRHKGINYGVIIMEEVDGMIDDWLHERQSGQNLDKFMKEMNSLFNYLKYKKATHGDLGFFNLGYKMKNGRMEIMLTDFDRSSMNVYEPNVDYWRYLIEANYRTQSDSNNPINKDNSRYLLTNLDKVGKNMKNQVKTIDDVDKLVQDWKDLYQKKYCVKAKVSCDL